MPKCHDTRLSNLKCCYIITLNWENILDNISKKKIPGKISKKKIHNTQKKIYLSFENRLNIILKQENTIVKNSTITTTREDIIKSFSNISKPIFSYRRMMKQKGFTEIKNDDKEIISFVNEKISDIDLYIKSILSLYK